MKTIFTLGLNESVDDSGNMDTKVLYDLVGQNPGNLAFHYGINRLIGFVPNSTPWGSSADKINIMGDIGIIPCANQLGVHTDMASLANNLNGVNAKLVAVGLGAQSTVGLDGIPELTQGTLSWLEQVVKHAASNSPNITVRGDFTLKVMEHYGYGGNAVSLGCPSLLINKSRDLGERLEKKYNSPYRKVAVAAGQIHWASMSALEASLVRIMEDTKGAYIVQSTDETIALSRNDFSYVDEKFKDKLRLYLKLNMDERQFDDWIRQYMISFYHVPSWMEYLRRFDFVVGARIHGIILAMQVGVPGLCIAHDSRIRELCEKCKIPFVMAKDVKDGMTIQDLRTLSVFDGKAFDKNREEIAAEYQKFFVNNGIM